VSAGLKAERIENRHGMLGIPCGGQTAVSRQPIATQRVTIAAQLQPLAALQTRRYQCPVCSQAGSGLLFVLPPWRSHNSRSCLLFGSTCPGFLTSGKSSMPHLDPLPRNTPHSICPSLQNVAALGRILVLANESFVNVTVKHIATRRKRKTNASC
jgi:hypothetical protein